MKDEGNNNKRHGESLIKDSSGQNGGVKLHKKNKRRRKREEEIKLQIGEQ